MACVKVFELKKKKVQHASASDQISRRKAG